MKCKIVIRMDNAAFKDSEGENDAEARGNELAIILRELAAEVEMGCDPGDSHKAQDSNGNHVGALMIIDD